MKPGELCTCSMEQIESSCIFELTSSVDGTCSEYISSVDRRILQRQLLVLDILRLRTLHKLVWEEKVLANLGRKTARS